MAKKKNAIKNTVPVSLSQAIILIKQHAKVRDKAPIYQAVRRESDNLRLKFYEPVCKGNGSLSWGDSHHPNSAGSVPIANATAFAIYVS